MHERLAAATHSPTLQGAIHQLLQGQDAKKPEATCGHGVAFLQVPECFQLVLGILDTCLLAFVVVIEAHAVAHMCAEMQRPQLRIFLEVMF